MSKLVRDKIPEIIEKNEGKKPAIHIADSNEYWSKLKEKLDEEVKEFIKEPSQEELADILEIVYAIADYRKFNKTELENLRQKKAAQRGAFSKRIILE